MKLEMLTEEEIDFLDDFLSSRINEDDETIKDEGIYDISSLDGFFAAVVSGPTLIQPSQWLSSIWGDFEPEWENEEDFMKIFTLMTRHMNGVINNLMSDVEFIPLFLEFNDEGKSNLIVDEWCDGYLRGIELTREDWKTDKIDMDSLLFPMRAFGTPKGWEILDKFDDAEVEAIQNTIALNVKDIHAFWLEQRENLSSENNQTFRYESPQVGRNDPCPCGSGKKYKKCCLH